MAGGNNHELWTRLVEANYMRDARNYEGKCPTCKSPKDCNNYYCLHCKQGGLCPILFRDQGAHHRHAWLQVRRQSLQDAVNPGDLERFISHESTKYIQKSSQNNSTLCYLRARISEPAITAPGSSSKPPKTPQVGKLKRCKGCTCSIHNSQASTEEFLVCSVECLITVAQRQPERNLLRMNDGAMDPSDVFPLIALEKIKVRALSTAKTVPGHVVDQPGSSSAGGSAPSEAPGGQAPKGRRAPRVAGSAPSKAAGGQAPGGRPAPPVAGTAPSEAAGGQAPGGRRAPPVAGTAPSEAAGGRSSGSRRAPPVDYRRLHEGGTDDASAGSSRAPRRSASRVQAPDNSAIPVGGRSEGLLHLIQAIQSTGDWDRVLGDLGRGLRTVDDPIARRAAEKP